MPVAIIRGRGRPVPRYLTPRPLRRAECAYRFVWDSINARFWIRAFALTWEEDVM